VTALIPELPFTPAPDVLSTSLDNFSIALHVVPMLANAGRIGSGSGFRFYREGITVEIAHLMSAVDAERLDIGRRFGAQVIELESYLVGSMGAPGGGLYRSIQGCPPYETVPAPTALDHKYLWEEVVAGVVPMIELGEVVGADTPLLRALLALSSSLLGRDLAGQGRTLTRMGLAGLDREEIRATV
jgi:opine dehydrogenase